MNTTRAANFDRVSRRRLLQVGAAGLGGASLGVVPHASAAPVTIRYATGGGIGPNEMETNLSRLSQAECPEKLRKIIHARNDVHARDSGSRDVARLRTSRSWHSCIFNLRNRNCEKCIAGGLSIISDNYQDGHAGNSTIHF